MRVYAESNFVLEIILEQEQHKACDELVNLALKKSIELALPAFSLLEPYQTLVRRRLERDRLRKDIDQQRKQLVRTASMVIQTQRLLDASDLLFRADQATQMRFADVCASLLNVAYLVAIDGSALREASILTANLNLELPDALILASVLSDAKGRPSSSVFINRNSKDFQDPDIRNRLKDVNCKFISSFDDGLTYVKSALAKGSASDL